MSGPGDRVLGAYRLVERIGREAAMKVLPASLVNEADFLRRFEREAASAAALEHPRILPVWDYDGPASSVCPVAPRHATIARWRLAPAIPLAGQRGSAHGTDRPPRHR